MGALVLPKRLTFNSQNRALCARIGIDFNGQDMGNRVYAYDVEAETIRLQNGDVLNGKVEPYWRGSKRG